MTIAYDESFPDPQHARWGQGSALAVSVSQIQTAALTPKSAIPTLVHPEYSASWTDWEKWRLCYEGGDEFVEHFTKRFSRRESSKDFIKRKAVTPIPAFAKAAINEIKNSIFQRMADIARVGGSVSYQRSILGLDGGVDLKGATMNWFMGHFVIPELLVMQKIGIFVDNLQQGPSIAQRSGHPYIYIYQAENMRSWAYSQTGYSTVYSALLLRDFEYIIDEWTGLPLGTRAKYRFLKVLPDGGVEIQFYDQNGSISGEPIFLNIPEIPYVTLKISASLMRDVANHQIALLNLESSDVAYALKGNFPFYTEQYDARNNNPAILAAQTAYNAQNPENCPPGQSSQEEEIVVGSAIGRRYGIGLERPKFIAPPPDPMRVSMEKQDNLKRDLRALVHLAVASLQSTRASAESKNFDRQGLESGLANIGTEIQYGEMQVARFWAMYEQTTPATVKYPEEWSLQSSADRDSEIDRLLKTRNTVPSSKLRRELNKQIVKVLLGNRLASSDLDKIYAEIDSAPGITSDYKQLIADLDAGIVSQITVALLRGYSAEEVAKAADDHASRLARIQAAQIGPAIEHQGAADALAAVKAQDSGAARGLPDLSPNPKASAKAEKIGKPQRGPGK